MTIQSGLVASTLRSECILESILYQLILMNQNGDVTEAERLFAASINDVNTLLDKRLAAGEKAAQKWIDENGI